MLCLKDGKTKSCGCSTSEFRSQNSRKEYSYNAKTQVYLSYKHGAKRRNIEFNLTRELFLDLVIKNCYYCNSEPKTVKGKNFKFGSFTYNGLDRVNNNIVTCCETCNRAKLMMSHRDFLDWIYKVYKFSVENR